MSGLYAKETTVSVEKTKAAIEKTLMKYGATGFFSSWQEEPAMASIGFQLENRTMRVDMPMPLRGERRFTHDHNGRLRSKDNIFKKWEGAQRQRWRALLLIVKAKLEFIEVGLSTVEKEFMADVLLPNGIRLGDVISPQLQLAYKDGKMPLLLAPKGKR
jgi:hypothetical protein